jgi:hypothetical protein
MAFGAFQKSSQDFIATSASSHHPLHRIVGFWVPATQARPVRCGCPRSIGANGFLKNMPDFRRPDTSQQKPMLRGRNDPSHRILS